MDKLPNKRLELPGPSSASAAADNDILHDAAASAWARSSSAGR